MLIADQFRRGHELAERLASSGPDSAGDVEVRDDRRGWRDYSERLQRFVRELEAVASRLEVSSTAPALPPEPSAVPDSPADTRVFLVHGRSQGVTEAVARFLMRLGLQPILLDEQGGRGRTIIEKLEAQPFAFAVVLLTGDDIGALASEPERLRLRARQNVIFELGFSLAKLGRERVLALCEDGIELPSDFRGVEYRLLDPAGAWKSRLAKELHEAGLRFDALRVL